MASEFPRELPLTELPRWLETVRQDIGARLVLATDVSGNLIDLVTVDDRLDSPVLAALGAGELAATREIIRLTGSDTASPQTLIIENRNGCVVLCGDEGTLMFVAVLGPDSILGMARLELRKLAEIAWQGVDPNPAPPETAHLAQQIVSFLDFDL